MPVSLSLCRAGLMVLRTLQKSNNSHCTYWLVQVGVHMVEQAENEILNSKIELIDKLEGVYHCGLELVQNEFIQGLHDV